MNDSGQLRVVLDGAFNEQVVTTEANSMGKLHGLCNGIVVWLHWMTPLLVATFYLGFGTVSRPEAMAPEGAKA
jgi:hypothetical protein